MFDSVNARNWKLENGLIMVDSRWNIEEILKNWEKEILNWLKNR